MQPHIHLNVLAILAAILAKAVLGYLWYGPFFGRAWNRERGLAAGFKAPAASLRRSDVLRWIGLALTVYVLALGVEVIRPSTWNAGADTVDPAYGFLAALFAWIGFYLPQLLSRVAWEGTSWKILRVHAFYHLVALQVAGQILANWR